MRKGDSALLHKCFHDDVRMFTSYVSKEGKAVLEEGSLQDFLIVVGTPHNNIWDEKIWNVSIKVDDNIAHVWCDYGRPGNSRFTGCFGLDWLKRLPACRDYRNCLVKKSPRRFWAKIMTGLLLSR